MRINEVIIENNLNEIERLSRYDYTGGKDYLHGTAVPKKFFPLPGGSGLLYSIGGTQSEPVIKMWDPTGTTGDPEPKRSPYEFSGEYNRRLARWRQRQESGKKTPQIVGKLSLERPWTGFPIKGALQVGTITVDEDYRGAGIAKALYGIVLTIMKRPLIAGSSQTPGGRRNWVSLSQIPGVELKGYVAIDDYNLRAHPNPKDNYDRTRNARVEERIDVIMGKLGGQYIGQNRREGQHYFAFDVKPTTDGKELETYVKQNLIKVYNEDYNLSSGLYAVWTGQ